MFGLFKPAKAHSVHIEGLSAPLTVNGKETILSAALRQGIDFPHSCRVGGCGSCKCQLQQGKVKELTEFAYVLSDEELDQGYILACQSVPRSDLQIQVDGLATTPNTIAGTTTPDTTAPKIALPSTIDGRIIHQQQLTADIVALNIELEQPLHYRAGQYALLSVPGAIAAGRSYSFASAAPASGTRQVQFFIRQVDGGELSDWSRGPVRNSPVQLTGPFGQFYLRDSEQPLLLIAAGSGLAPIMALLEQALADACQRPLVLLFGARSQQDLYCLDQIADLQRQWPTGFEFVPVLSAEPDHSDWSGARGRVTDLLADYTNLATTASPTSSPQVYMCGPPAMLDAIQQRLLQLGLPPSQIFSDRFLDRFAGQTATPATSTAF